MNRSADVTGPAPALGSLQPSMTLGVTSKAKAMKAAGEDVVSLCAGEPDFDTPQHIKDAAAAALAQGETKYTPSSGRPDLRKAIADKLRTENGLAYEPSQVIVGPGAKFSVFAAVAALCGPGDEVLVPVPYWLSYAEMVRAAGATMVPIQPSEGWVCTPEDVKRCVTPRTRLMILNTPSNPSGVVYDRTHLEGIARLAVAHDFLVLADEIYEKLVYDPGFEHVSVGSLGPEIQARTITVNGFSKAYSMTGWRLGYVAAPAWLAKRIDALQSHTTSNATTFAQFGALAALSGPQEPVAEMREAFAKRRDRIYELLSAIPGVKVSRPHGAFYIFPDISAAGLDSMTFAERLLNEARVAVIPGNPFGADGCVRLSYACSMETIEEAVGRMAGFIAELLSNA